MIGLRHTTLVAVISHPPSFGSVPSGVSADVGEANFKLPNSNLAIKLFHSARRILTDRNFFYFETTEELNGTINHFAFTNCSSEQVQIAKELIATKEPRQHDADEALGCVFRGFSQQTAFQPPSTRSTVPS